MNPNRPLLIAIRVKLHEIVAMQKSDKVLLSKPHNDNSWLVQSQAAYRAADISALHDLAHELCGRPHQHNSDARVRMVVRLGLEQALVAAV